MVDSHVAEQSIKKANPERAQVIQRLVDLVKAETGDTCRVFMIDGSDGAFAQVPCVVEKTALPSTICDPISELSYAEDLCEPQSVLFEHPEKGVCMKASRIIPRGNVILRERPFFLLPKQLERTLSIHALIVEEMLTTVQRLDYFRLDDSSGLAGCDILQNIYDTNSHSTPIAGALHSAVFPISSRISHACAPNAVHHFDTSTMQFTLRATRDIQYSEEITISYYPLEVLLLPIKERVNAIRAHRKFRCICRVCTQEETASRASDARRRSIQGQTDSLIEKMPKKDCLGLIEQLLHLHNVEELDTGRTTLHSLAVSVCQQNNLRDDGKIWARRALDEVRVRHGPNGHQAKEIQRYLRSLCEIRINDARDCLP